MIEVTERARLEHTRVPFVGEPTIPPSNFEEDFLFVEDSYRNKTYRNEAD